jgi:hypothetical protein
MKQTALAKQAFLAENLRKGEVYGGIVLGKDGEPDYHLFAQTKFIESATFEEVKAYVEKVGGEGATRRDLALLRVNAPEPFGTKAFWSCEQHAAGSFYAWCQYFGNGFQYFYRKSNLLCGVAVRRLEIL